MGTEEWVNDSSLPSSFLLQSFQQLGEKVVSVYHNLHDISMSLRAIDAQRNFTSTIFSVNRSKSRQRTWCRPHTLSAISDHHTAIFLRCNQKEAVVEGEKETCLEKGLRMANRFFFPGPKLPLPSPSSLFKYVLIGSGQPMPARRDFLVRSRRLTRQPSCVSQQVAPETSVHSHLWCFLCSTNSGRKIYLRSHIFMACAKEKNQSRLDDDVPEAILTDFPSYDESAPEILLTVKWSWTWGLSYFFHDSELDVGYHQRQAALFAAYNFDNHYRQNAFSIVCMLSSTFIWLV